MPEIAKPLHIPRLWSGAECFGFGGDDVPDHDALRKAEAQRRELLRRSKLHHRYHHHFQIWGSVLPAVVLAWEFWLTVGVYVGMRLLLHYEVVSVDGALQVDFRWMTVVGGFISFLLVFYNNQIYSRFAAQYENSMRIEGRIFNSAFMARDHMPTEIAWQYVRYLNGAHVLGYVGLSPVYERSNFFEPFNQKLHLFTAHEVMRLDEINMMGGGTCYREVIGWALRILYEAYKQGHIDVIVYNTMLSEVLQLRGCIGTLFDYNDQPIPFVYVHLVYFLTLFYLPLFAFFVAITLPVENHWGNIVAILTVLINNIFTIGLLEIGRFMSLPYGAHLCDLSVIHYINFTLLASRKVLAGKTFVVNGITIEQHLEENRPHLGNGFSSGIMHSEKVRNRGFSYLITTPQCRKMSEGEGESLKGEDSSETKEDALTPSMYVPMEIDVEQGSFCIEDAQLSERESAKRH